MKFGILYIVATPIGNLEDISKRALTTLESVALTLAEDTRVTKKLFERYKITSPLKSYHQHSGENKKLMILKTLIEGANIALVSDAGTPGISDPGNELVDYLLDKEPKIKVVAIPGPSAITAAVSICGFDVNKFTFLGFFPKKKRSKLLTQISGAKTALVFYESPNRLLRTLGELRAHLGDTRRIFVGRELTKMYESVYRGTIKSVAAQVKADDLRGEVVVIIEKKK